MNTLNWAPVTLPEPSTLPGYLLDHDLEKGYRLLLKGVQIISWQKNYEDLLSAFHALLEEQKSGEYSWLNPATQVISTGD